MNFLSLLSAFGAGFLASLSPCVYPMVPVTLGFMGSQSTEKLKFRAKLFAFLSGQVLSIAALGVLTVSLGETLGFTSEDPRITLGTGILLLLFGVASLVGHLPKFLTRLNNHTHSRTRHIGGGTVGALFLGMATALIATPCTTPILSGILTLISQSQTKVSGAFLMLAYALGFVTLFALLGFGLLRSQRLPRSGHWLNYVHKFGALLLVFTGIYYLALGFGIRF